MKTTTVTSDEATEHPLELTGNILVAQVSLEVDLPRVFCLASTFILRLGLCALAASLFFR